MTENSGRNVVWEQIYKEKMQEIKKDAEETERECKALEKLMRDTERILRTK